tara:strand:- start:22 stop:225 length:204 start_codon:yes stop_codon:yes gene_type:complete
MKKFHLFLGDGYYPAKFYDYKGSFASIGDAIAACGDEWDEIGRGFKWFQVLETQEDGSLKLVEENAK